MNEPIISFGFRGWGSRQVKAGIRDLPMIIQARLVAGVQNRIREIAVENLKEVTPVRTGKLQGSTIGLVQIGQGMAIIDLEQPAENEAGQQYGGYVVRGHYTQADTLVPPNPYPQEAMERTSRAVNRVAHEIGQQIAKDTVYVMGKP